MVGIIFLNQHMAVEPAHLRDGKDADGAKGTGGNRQHFPLGDISADFCVRSALQTVKGNIPRRNIPFQSPWVTSSGRLRAIISWYFISQKDSLLDGVFPQWNPIKVSFSA